MSTRRIWRRRTVVVEREAFTVVWDGRKGAPSLLGDRGHEDHTIERGRLTAHITGHGPNKSQGDYE